MIHTLGRLAASAPSRAPCRRPRRRARRRREPQNAPSSPAMWPSVRPSKPCCAAATCSVFRMSNLTTYFVRLELAHAAGYLRAGLRVAEVVGELELAAAAARGCVRSSTWKLAFDSSISPKSAMLFAVNFCRNVALLLLISPGMHDQRRALLVRVGVHRPAGRSPGRRLVRLLRRLLAGGRRRTAERGLALAPRRRSATSATPSGEAEARSSM